MEEGEWRNPILLSKAALIREARGKNNRFAWGAVLLMLAMIAGMAALHRQGRSLGPLPAMLILVSPFGLLALYSLLFGNRNRERLAKRLAEGDFLLVENRVTRRELFEDKSSSIRFRQPTCYWIWFYKPKDQERRKLQVPEKVYDTFQTNMACYLVILDKTRIWKVYPACKYRLDQELSDMLCRDPDVIGEGLETVSLPGEES